MRFSSSALACALALLPACELGGSNGYTEPGPRPQLVNVAGPRNAVVTYDADAGGGNCPLPIDVTFRLPADQFVWKAYVRFQGDGGDIGVDRPYLVATTYGKGDADATLTIDAAVPPTILRRSALFTYSVRLVTGVGEESTEATLTVSVQ